MKINIFFPVNKSPLFVTSSSKIGQVTLQCDHDLVNLVIDVKTVNYLGWSEQ